MHAEEGIVDAGNLKKTHGIRRFDTNFLHRYHLFFLEIHHTSTFSALRQGQSRSDGMTYPQIQVAAR